MTRETLIIVAGIQKRKEESLIAENNLVGRCGLYCGACTIYRAYEDSGEYRNRVAAYFKCPPEKVRCEGCQALTPECWGNDCEIVKCTTAKGLSFCYQCPQFDDESCMKFEDLAKRYMENNVDVRSNLSRIKAGQVEEWLGESKERFKCPYCKKPLTEGSTKCYHCGKTFERML